MICGGFHAATAKAKGTLATKQYPWSFPGTPVVRRQGVRDNTPTLEVVDSFYRGCQWIEVPGPSFNLYRTGDLHPRKFNMEPEDHGFQKDFPFPWTYFQVPCWISGV